MVIGGLVLAIPLAALSYVAGSVTYESQAEGPDHAAELPLRTCGGAGRRSVRGFRLGNSAVLAGLSPVYAQIANSNQIAGSVRKQARVPGTVTASEVSDLASGANLPFVQLVSTSPRLQAR